MHVHTPVAAVLGRIAAKMAGVPTIIYTAHGFYFHDRMPRHIRIPIVWIEKILGRMMSDMVLTQSAEDAKTAIQEGISRADRV